MNLVNTQCRLAARPVGLPKPSDWQIVDEAAGSPADGEFLVRVEYLSVDPAMRTWMNAGRSYVPPVEIGEVMRAGRHRARDRFASLRFRGRRRRVWRVRSAALRALGRWRRDSRSTPPLAPAPVHLGVLGISGLTAYFGLLDVGRPQPGQTVVVSGAAGSVGSIAGQIARIKGCRAIGIAGGADKCRWLVDELGFDAAIDYKAGDLRAQLKTHAPDGSTSSSTTSAARSLEAAAAARARRTRRAQRRRLAVQRHRELRGPGQLHAAAGHARLDDRLRDLRLRRPLRRGRCAAGELAAQR